ncbi:MAG: hemerythrin domain-containing protein [Frankiaceae bacterium]|nr:hemerythrin domain-containing protein [Frankiaceae bacterium]
MPDAIVLLKNDHKTVERLFKQFEKLGGSSSGAHKTKRDVVDKIIQELSIHAAIEEQHFYPTIREQAPDISDDVLEGLEEHHVVKWTLSELKDMSPQAERFDAKVTVLIEMVRHHVEEEEADMFPKVREAMGRKDLQVLGETMEKAKAISPKQPHPKAPDTPPGNLIAGPAAAAADSVKAAAKKGLLRRGR